MSYQHAPERALARYLKVPVGFGRLSMSFNSACDLAAIPRTYRRFYRLAMPSLWYTVDLSPYDEWPQWLSAYPGTASKHALSFVRHPALSLYLDDDPATDDFYQLHRYVSGLAVFECLKTPGQYR